MRKFAICTAGVAIAFQLGLGQTSQVQLPDNFRRTVPDSFSYVVGPGDHVMIDVMDAEELGDLTGKELQVSSDGYINVPTIGRIRASGLTMEQLQAELASGLKKYVREPHVFVNVTSVKSQSVSVIGAVKSPGVQQLEGPKTVTQVLAMAGGLATEAGYQIKITRDRRWGIIPLPNAEWDSSKQYSTAEILAKDLMDAKSPKENILVRPNDVITVPRAQLIYVIGEVRKPGGFTLGDHSSIPLLQALALAEGLTTTAQANKARVLRTTDGSKVRSETNVDLSKLAAGKVADIDLAANDILVVPNNSTRRAQVKIAETALSTISGIIIWHGL